MLRSELPFSLDTGPRRALAFAYAADRRQFLGNPWRWLDLPTVLLALGSLLPSATGALRSAPILRLARLGRLVSFGLRAGSLSARQARTAKAAAMLHGPAKVTPWAITLPQVAFCVFFGMVFGLYLFVIKGWLR